MSVVCRISTTGGVLAVLAVAAALAGLTASGVDHDLVRQAHAAQQEAGGDCYHPFVPTEPGTWRRYELKGPGDSTAVMDFRLLDLQALQKEQVATWEIEVSSSLFPKFRMEVRPRCTPGGDAEGPWFGYMPAELNFTTRGDRWRWPRELVRGAMFSGTIEFVLPEGIPGAQSQRAVILTRNHVVESREAVTVPAGSFEAWRVAFKELSTFADTREELEGVMWVADDVGLVRAVIKQGKRTQERVLVAFGGT